MQDPSNSLDSRFGFHLVGLARRWRRALDEALAARGFADASWVPMVHLAENGGISQRDLALRCGLDDSTLVRLLDALTARGWVERRAKPNDRRARCVHLTEAGAAAVVEIRAILAASEGAMLAGVERADLVAAMAMFDRIEGGIAAFAEQGARP